MNRGSSFTDSLTSCFQQLNNGTNRKIFLAVVVLAIILFIVYYQSPSDQSILSGKFCDPLVVRKKMIEIKIELEREKTKNENLNEVIESLTEELLGARGRADNLANYINQMKGEREVITLREKQLIRQLSRCRELDSIYNSTSMDEKITMPAAWMLKFPGDATNEDDEAEKERSNKIILEVEEKMKAMKESAKKSTSESSDVIRVSLKGKDSSSSSANMVPVSVLSWEERKIAREFRLKSNLYNCDKGLMQGNTDEMNPWLTHTYHWAYGHFLHGAKGKKLKILEIGLGCGMITGVGLSASLWVDYLGENIDLNIIEYDGKCVEEFLLKNTTVAENVRRHARIFIGDQANTTFLEEVVWKASGGTGFDIVIDDGGHMVEQQVTSLRYLFQWVRRGGLYFLEDLATSYTTHFTSAAIPSAVEKIKDLLDGINRDKISQNYWSMYNSFDSMLMPYIHSVSCWREICVFTRA